MWMAKPDAYREDLAYIHDAGYGHFAENAGGLLVDLLQRGKLGTGLVIDLGCGSGVLAKAVSAAGYPVLGIDISGPMLALARKHVPNGEFREESILRAKLPPCIAVAAVGECFNYLFDAGNNETARLKVLGRVFRALAPGGIFLFDVAGPGRVPGNEPRRFHTEGEGWAVLVQVEGDRQQRLLTRSITTFRKIGDLYRRDHEVHRQRLFAPAEIKKQLAGIGFRVRVLKSYGELQFGAGHAGFLGRKPG
jgi:SAM-dependent methyltransferase